MFWGSFFGSQNGPFLFWDKKQGIMNKDSLCERIASILAAIKKENPGILYMQNGAPSDSAGQTIDKLRTDGIVSKEWPPCSPHLNPIECFWNGFKKFLQFKFPELVQKTK